jgi:hypothetical protein
MTEREAIRRTFAQSPELVARLRQLLGEGRLIGFESAPVNEELLVLCGTRTSIDGSQQRRCACKAIIWISPSTIEMLARRPAGAPEATLLCPSCAAQLSKKGAQA